MKTGFSTARGFNRGGSDDSSLKTKLMNCDFAIYVGHSKCYLNLSANKLRGYGLFRKPHKNRAYVTLKMFSQSRHGT